MSDEILKQILNKLDKIDGDVQGLKEDSSLVKRAVLEIADTVNRIEKTVR